MVYQGLAPTRLRLALKQLGYNECHHASVFVAQEPSQGPQWCRIAWRKYHSDTLLSPEERGLDASEFDKCLGNCMATTDMPGATFACELIRAYPDAKVIINTREDTGAWYQSVIRSFDDPKVPSPFGQWRTAIFDPELFWLKAGRDAMWAHMMGYDFAANGKEAYQKHYQDIDELLEAERNAGRERKVLGWKVEDGWSSLVGFLCREVQKDELGLAVDFPKGNKTEEFQKYRTAVTMKKVERAKRRRWVTFIVAAGALTTGMAWWFRSRP